jgi:hypothetical protein
LCSKRRAVNADIRMSNAALDLHLYPRYCGEGELRVSGVNLRWRGAHERERYDVPRWIAALQMSRSVIRMARCGAVLVGRQPVMVLGVVVILVRVRVEERRYAEHRNQRRDEQHCQRGMHNLSL